MGIVCLCKNILPNEHGQKVPMSWADKLGFITETHGLFKIKGRVSAMPKISH